MKLHYIIFTVIITFFAGCSGSPGSKTDVSTPVDTVVVPDTGFTGIKQFMSGQYKVSEVTFKNGVRQGLTKTFYRSGKLQRTFWYESGLRQDSSCWFYEEGQLFRTTPFINDTINGIQKQFYRTGELKAELGYSGGLRTLYFKEYSRDGKLISNYPELLIKTEDKYNINGTYNITLSLSDLNNDVKFYRGDIVNGVYDTTKVEKIRKSGNTGLLGLRKKPAVNNDSVGIIAEILTNFGNRLIVYKKLELPYKDLK
ncbi:MAG TPA: hypothetical protein VK213_10095 [Bacteroidales bacterium]|nr:hypothetical protein [Bacteroidales bacterium]